MCEVMDTICGSSALNFMYVFRFSCMSIYWRRSNQRSSSALKIHQSRHKLPNKPTDFQVRVHVLEARKLVGTNLNTTVKVICGMDVQQTSTQKGTDNPVFDEVRIVSTNIM